MLAEVLFITGTDTGVGKSVLTAHLLGHLRRSGRRALAVKPFATGSYADTRLLRRVQNGALSQAEITPFFFPEPVAPLVAAQHAGRLVSRKMVLVGLRAARSRCELLLIEGCGGLLAPLGPRLDALDLMRDLEAAVVVVAVNKLGVLNHTLLTVQVLRRHGLRRLCVVLMGRAQPDLSAASNGEVLRRLLTPTPVVDLGYLGPGAKSFAALEHPSATVRRGCARILRGFGWGA